MKNNVLKIALGGGCHWCTEAVFQSLKGVEKVEQGYVASYGADSSFSEAIVIYYNTSILLRDLIEIHLHTHQSSSHHSMRNKYRSAIYTFSEKQHKKVIHILNELQSQFENKLITKALSFSKFKASREEIQNYYLKKPNKPFCKKYINPKLQFLLNSYSSHIKKETLLQLENT